MQPPYGASGSGSSSIREVPSSVPASAEVDDEELWRMNMRRNEAMEPGPYPERPGEPDCSFYMRTGLCRFGNTCKFNHPLNRKLAVAAAQMKGEYPLRIGQPECQYYLKTGTCKFGATCKFHHPRDKAGIAGRVQLNILGYPLRPNEMDCSYYLRTGQCKFGNTCKFHHPQPSNTVVPVSGSLYSTSQHSYPSSLTNWPLTRASFITSSRWQGPSSHYAQLFIPQGLVQVPNWNSYPAHLGSSSDDQQRSPGTSQYYPSMHQSETSAATGEQGAISSYQSGTIPFGLYPVQRESIFPERPDQPECQFYMKTGDCKFGAVCKFHHPKERLIPAPNCALSQLGLPLRPGEQICSFYSRYGICKFGPSCKFDHPIGTVMYSHVTSSSADMPASRHLLAPSEGAPDNNGSGRTRRFSHPESLQISSADRTERELS